MSGLSCRVFRICHWSSVMAMPAAAMFAWVNCRYDFVDFSRESNSVGTAGSAAQPLDLEYSAGHGRKFAEVERVDASVGTYDHLYAPLVIKRRRQRVTTGESNRKRRSEANTR